MQTIKDNAALIITILATLIIGGVGLALLSTSSEKPLTHDEKTSLLVKEDSQITGDINSQITVVEFSDFECPACGYYSEEFNIFKQNYGDRVKIVYRHFPLESIHPLAFKAAEASEAAGAQGKFWEFHDILFAKQLIWSLLPEDAAIEAFTGYANSVGVEDIERFKTELKDGTHVAKVQSDLNDAEGLRLKGTPSVFLNGTQLENPSYDNLSAQVDQLLAAQAE